MSDLRERAKRPSNWGRWGAADSLGTLNLITPQRRAEAARLVRTGVSIPLGLSFDRNGPQLADGSRQNPVHIMTRLPEPDATGSADLDDALFLHTRCATHVDGLARVSDDGLLYNGHRAQSAADERAGPLGIEAMRSGIQGRGVLLDLARAAGRERLDAGAAIEVVDFERAAGLAGAEIRDGDSLLLRTGWASVFTRDRDRARYLRGEASIAPGVAAWLRARDVAFLATDSVGIQAPVRHVLTRDLGMPTGGMFDLDALAEHCAAAGVGEFQFTCLPLPITGGVSSPVAPLATF